MGSLWCAADTPSNLGAAEIPPGVAQDPDSSSLLVAIGHEVNDTHSETSKLKKK